MVGITGREIAIYLGNRIFVRGFISGKRVLQVRKVITKETRINTAYL